MAKERIDLAPGSPYAVKKGCLCPIMDNNQGKGSGYTTKNGAPVFWYNLDCPLHGNAKPLDDNERVHK